MARNASNTLLYLAAAVMIALGTLLMLVLPIGLTIPSNDTGVLFLFGCAFTGLVMFSVGLLVIVLLRR